MSLPALSLFSLSSLGCLYRYMTALPMPLAFRRSLLMTGNCNKHIPINNTNTSHLPDTTGLQSLTADHWELHQEACNDQIHTWTHLALLTFGYPKSLHVFAPTYITTSKLQRHKHMCAYTFHPYNHLRSIWQTSHLVSQSETSLHRPCETSLHKPCKHLTLQAPHKYLFFYKHFTNISLYKHLTNISLYKHLTNALQTLNTSNSRTPYQQSQTPP